MSAIITSLILLIYFFMNSVLSISDNQTKTIYSLNIDVDYEENGTIILFYNITTNYSYYITFRTYGNEQLTYGVFRSTNKFEAKSIEIPYQYSTTETYHLFIVCFHFILQANNLDIYCKDIRLLNRDQVKSNSSEDFLPSYNPLFVPMMYALSIIMLLPVIIQHHRHKKALLLQRRKTLRRLSVHIAQDDQNPQQNLVKRMLSQFDENGDIIYENMPVEMKLLSAPSTETVLHDINDHNVTFTLHNLPPYVHDYDESDIDEQVDMNADDCVAHLLNNTPWNRPHSEQPLPTNLFRQPVVRDCATAIKEQHVLATIPFHDEDDDDRKPILKTNKNSSRNIHKTNRVFFETDV